MITRSECVFGYTFATTEDEVLVCSSECASDDEFALLLSQVPFDYLRVVNLDELNFTVGHVDEHML